MPASKPVLINTNAASAASSLVGLVLRYEFVRFLVSGAIAALLNLLIAWGYRQMFHGTVCYFEASVVLGFSIGTGVSFVLNKFFTFRARETKVLHQVMRFTLIALVSIAISTIVAHLILSGLILLPGMATNAHRCESLAHIATIGVMTVFNYFAIKHLAFLRAGITP